MVIVKKANVGIIRQDSYGSNSISMKDDYYDFLSDESVDVVRKQFRTTKNAEIINVYRNGILIRQFVVSYKTFVLEVSPIKIEYTGYISSTTVKHILRYFKEYGKFGFKYEWIGAKNRVPIDNQFHIIK